MKDLEGRVAVVAGATRGAGRGIATMLGEAGATVYCTGRRVRGQPATEGRTETIEDTAELVSELGGRGVCGRQPDWGGYFDRTVAGLLDRGEPLTPDDRFLLEMRRFQIDLDPDRRDEAERITALLGGPNAD